MKKLISLILVVVMVVSLVACSGSESSDTAESTRSKHITIAYQQGIGYAMVHILEAKELIEKYYGEGVDVTFQLLASGAAINEGIIGGNIDIGCMGTAPAISGVIAGIPYKCISAINAQPNGLMTYRDDINSLSDISAEDKIATVNTGSIQHIMLAMACEKYLGDAHALDNNIQPMQHAEGMAALESGTVALHLTSFPFIGQERENPKYHELTELSDTCPAENTFLVAMASTKLAEDTKLLEAVRSAFKEASDLIATNKDEVADIEAKYLSMDKETVLDNLNNPDVSFNVSLKGVGNIIDFMRRAEFITSDLKYSDFIFDGVEGD